MSDCHNDRFMYGGLGIDVGTFRIGDTLQGDTMWYFLCGGCRLKCARETVLRESMVDFSLSEVIFADILKNQYSFS